MWRTSICCTKENLVCPSRYLAFSIRPIVVVLLVSFYCVDGQDNDRPAIADIKALSDKLLENYSKYILPSAKPGPFNVSVYVRLHAVGEIDEIEEKLSTVLWFYFNWVDESIKWNNNETNISFITLSWNDVWAPILRVTNPHADVTKSQSTDRSYDVVIFNSDGMAWFDEMMTTRTTCDLDMSYYPFDIQSCNIDMAIIGEKKFWFKLNAYVYEAVSVDDAYHGSWTLVNKSVSSEFGTFKINLKFKRRPLFILVHVLFPIIVLALLTPIVFVLPKKSGERVGYAITMLLAISVYMTIVSENLPQNSQPMPLISIMVFVWYILDSIIVFIVIINTKINTTPDTKPVAWSSRKFVVLTRKIMSFVTCEKQKGKTDDGSSEETESCICSDNAKNGKATADAQSPDKDDLLIPEKITWQDLSNAIDKWCFVISYIFKIVIPVVFLSVTKAHSHLEST